MGGRGRPLSCCPYEFEDKCEFKTSMLWSCYILPPPASLVFLLGSLYKPLVNHWGRPTFILKMRPNIKTFSRLKRPPNPSRETPKILGVTGFTKWAFFLKPCKDCTLRSPRATDAWFQILARSLVWKSVFGRDQISLLFKKTRHCHILKYASWHEHQRTTLSRFQVQWIPRCW